VRVARELCDGLSSIGYQTEILAGVSQKTEAQTIDNHSESYVQVKPILKNYKFSTLWSCLAPFGIVRKIKSVDLVHIHFARDLIPIFSALTCIFLSKPYFTQTHSMVIRDFRMLPKIVDKVLIRVIMKRAKENFVLNEREREQLEIFDLGKKPVILANGIAEQSNIFYPVYPEIKQIVFCSRLSEQKGLDKFLEMAKLRGNLNCQFRIYGPDAGVLNWVKQQIAEFEMENYLQYMGALSPSGVRGVIAQSTLLVLPSYFDAFPMIVLESLALGTPVLVMPSCGIAEELVKFNPNFVAKSENTEGLLLSFDQLMNESKNDLSREAISEFCKTFFGIEKSTSILQERYAFYAKSK